jgi:hypothetical protein
MKYESWRAYSADIDSDTLTALNVFDLAQKSFGDSRRYVLSAMDCLRRADAVET